MTVTLLSSNYGERADYAALDLTERPLLQAALANRRPANSYKVEWLIDRLTVALPDDNGVVRGHVEIERQFNYTQILRRAFKRRLKQDGTFETFDEAAGKALDAILDDAERVLWYGRRDYTVSPWPCGMSGGVYHLMRRQVYENDTVALRELCPLTLLRHRGLHDQFTDEKYHTHEWLWEFSLQVNPGHYQRGMRPLFPKPAPASVNEVNAWGQGASLGDDA